MSKRFIGVCAALAMVFGQAVFAAGEEDSPAAYCADEARDSGIVEDSEIQAYVADCVQQISQEQAQEAMIEREGEVAEVNPEAENAEPADAEAMANMR